MIGFGVDLLFEVESGKAAMFIAGLGTAGGLLAGTAMTRNFDKGKDISLLGGKNSRLKYAHSFASRTWDISPRMTLQHHPYQQDKFVPSIGVQFSMR